MRCERSLYITVKDNVDVQTTENSKSCDLRHEKCRQNNNTRTIDLREYNTRLSKRNKSNSNAPYNRISIDKTNHIPKKKFHETIEDTYVASVDTDRGVRDILRIYDTAGLQGSVQVKYYLPNANHIDNELIN